MYKPIPAESSNFPLETPLKSPWNPLEIFLNIPDDKTIMNLMILTLNALQKYVYTYTCRIQTFPPWNPLEISLKPPWNPLKSFLK